MPKQIGKVSDTKGVSDSNSDEALEKKALIGEIMRRIDTLDPDELKLLHRLSLCMRSRERDKD